MDELISYWQKEYKYIYSIEIAGQQYVYRALTLSEINEIDNNPDISSADVEDIYVQTAVLYPQDFDINRLKAGYVTQLAEQIMQVSGITDPDFITSSLNYDRDQMNGMVNMMKVFIISAMPTYNDEYLDSLTMRELIFKTALAEQILTLNQQIQGIQTEGVKLELQFEQDQQHQQQPTQKEVIDKEVLLRRIRKQEKESGSFDPEAISKLDEFDPELLIRASGIPRADDPIARKLREAMGG